MTFKNILSVCFLFFSCSLFGQLQLDVDGDGIIKGDLTVNSNTNNPLSLETSSSTNYISLTPSPFQLGALGYFYNNDRFSMISTTDLTFHTGSSTPSMIITETGRLVGIRTGTPESDLHINQSGGSGPTQGTGGICLENGSNRWRIYNSSNGTVPFIRFNLSQDDGATYAPQAWIANDGAYTQVSDRSLKNSIEELPNVLSLIDQLQTKKYYYNHNQLRTKKSIGFIAQEVEEVFPELVSSETEEGLLGINYTGFSVIAIKAIQEQQAIIESLLERIEKLEANQK